MHIRLPLGRTLFFLCAFLFCMVALLPLRLALGWLGLDARGFAAREALGSIWLGAVREAEFGPVPVGDLGTRLGTLPLLIGRARIEVRRPGDEDGMKGALTVSRHGFGLDDADASLDTAAAFAPLPLQSIDLRGMTAHFTEGLCTSAGGLVKAQVAGSVAGVVLPAAFSGDPRCEAGALLLPLVSQSGQERLAISLFEDGRYKVELGLPAGDDPTRQRLTAAGFAAAGNGYALRIEGRF